MLPRIWRMNIRQIAVQYDVEADRLLLRVRSAEEQLFAIWLTRRLCLRLWPHLGELVQRADASQALAQAAPQSTATPEARAMLAETARERTLAQSDFSQPFEVAATAQQPLGALPLLAHTVQMTALAQGRLLLAIRDAQQRSVQLELEAAMATAVRELMAAALRQADWGFALDAAPQVSAPRVLN
jgi:hypothetical protein